MVKPRENRVPIMMSEDELRAVDDWRFKNRIATRSDALRRLARIGAVVDEWVADADQKIDEAFNSFFEAIEGMGELSKERKRHVNDAYNALMDMLLTVAQISVVSSEMRKGSDINEALAEAWNRVNVVTEIKNEEALRRLGLDDEEKK